MKITIVGTGYVGLVTGACLADTGNEIWCVDKNESKIRNLEKGILPLYEPGLESLVQNGFKKETLFFTTEIAQAVKNTAICFLCVDTPLSKEGSPDLTNIFAATEVLGAHLTSPCLIVTKSTVPVGTTKKIKEILEKKLRERNIIAGLFSVASNPEFLREGSAVQDFQHPDRIVAGVEKTQDAELLEKLYKPFLRMHGCFLKMDIPSAEFAKYAANTMLASRISLINELANLSEHVGADIDPIREVLGQDPRIGPHFLLAGLGYGGSCLPKDVQALIRLGEEKKVSLPMISAIQKTNQNQRELFFKKLANHFGSEENLRDKTIAIWGLSFKPETDDIRESPAFSIIEKLLQYEARVRVFDPQALDKTRDIFQKSIYFAEDPYSCLEKADCLLVLTEWDIFKKPDFLKMKQAMTTPLIFDGRNIYSKAFLHENGFIYKGVGR
ncbi:MAG: hypothetical protein A3H42_06885 [Deltaproteobacteria bacterium RIFCSPLOWO2_02_FULL_46_8]|nr:MAG: hypothetical protein A3H42_06885 [Deltaproteobacteria bacterium RIFCSPLOWO2_02_FULL_46_8]